MEFIATVYERHIARSYAGDYTVWRKTLGRVGGPLAADGNTNGQIDIGDFTVWRSHLGQTVGSGAGATIEPSHTAVPEPTTVGRLASAAVLCVKRRRTIAFVSLLISA